MNGNCETETPNYACEAYSAKCPICFEKMDKTNIVVTECCHTFHTSCLMKNVAKNGFACPCCRKSMHEAEAPSEVPSEAPSEETFGEGWIYNRLYGDTGARVQDEQNIESIHEWIHKFLDDYGQEEWLEWIDKVDG